MPMLDRGSASDVLAAAEQAPHPRAGPAQAAVAGAGASGAKPIASASQAAF